MYYTDNYHVDIKDEQFVFEVVPTSNQELREPSYEFDSVWNFFILEKTPELVLEKAKEFFKDINPDDYLSIGGIIVAKSEIVMIPVVPLYRDQFHGNYCLDFLSVETGKAIGNAYTMPKAYEEVLKRNKELSPK